MNAIPLNYGFNALQACIECIDELSTHIDNIRDNLLIMLDVDSPSWSHDCARTEIYSATREAIEQITRLLPVLDFYRG